MKKKIKIEQLKPGMFIDRFGRSWLDHPFLKNRIKVSSEKTIRKIIEYKIHEVYIDTDKGLDVDDVAADEVSGKESRIEDSGAVDQEREVKEDRKHGSSEDLKEEANGARKIGRAEERKEETKEEAEEERKEEIKEEAKEEAKEETKEETKEELKKTEEDVKAALEKLHIEKEEKDKAPAEKKDEVNAEEQRDKEEGSESEAVPSENKEAPGTRGIEEELRDAESTKASAGGYTKEGADIMPSVDRKDSEEPKGIEEKAGEKEAGKKPKDAEEEIKGAEPRKEPEEAKEEARKLGSSEALKEETKEVAMPAEEGTGAKKDEKGKGPAREKQDEAGAGHAKGPEAQETGQRGKEEKGVEPRRGDVPVQDREMTMEELRREAIEQKERNRTENKDSVEEKDGAGFAVHDRRIKVEELRSESRDQGAQKGFEDNKRDSQGGFGVGSGGGSFAVNDRRMEDREAGWQGRHDAPEGTEDSKGEDIVRAPVSVQEELSKAKEIRNEAKKTMKKLLEDVRFGKQIEMEKVETVVEKMVDSIFRNKDALTGLGRIKKVDEYTFMHSVSVGVLLISFGKYLGFDYDLVKAIGIGGLLHDMGKIKVPGNILTKEGKLSDDEMRMMKKHVEDSRVILEKTPGINEISVYVAAHHHERLDGTGYPNHLKGEDISIFGQMSAIADVYDALTSDRCYQKGILPTEALKKLYGWNMHFNKELLQQFVRCMGIYPVGTLVRLQSGLLGVVLSHNEDNLMYPIVRVVYDTLKETFTMPSDINLLEEFQNGGTDKVIGYELPEKWHIRPETYL